MFEDRNAMEQPYVGAQIARSPDMKTRLDLAVQDAKDRLARAVRAREILANNPELEELINILQRGGI